MYSYRARFIFAVFAILLSLGVAIAALHDFSEINTADSTQKMYEDFNKAFFNHWRARTGVEVTVKQARSKSGVPIRAVVDGLDVVSLALSYDPVALQKSSKFMLPHWVKPVPQNTPFTSTIVFLVRKGNPKGLRDWGDLTRSTVEVITSDPKNSSSARWNYLAAWGYAFRQSGGSNTAALEFVRKLFANVKVMDSGTRGSVNTFAERGVGDVLLAWENEAHLLAKEGNGDKFEVVTPSLSILAEPTVSVINDVPDQAGAHEMTKAYIDYLYSTKAQDIAAKHCYRPRDEKVIAKYAMQFPQIELFTVDEVFGGWKEAQNVHFSNGGAFDQMQGSRADPVTGEAG
ncbi:sulfate transport system substrate-binding protein [Nitrosospira sp. Nsp11]|uniref:sulfate ABC transporter substrate-binding protein n=1 Tax=Nitrosospira sp. Nsp11 TaxID=1855338 RepID=UPI00091E7275|nr:sulfate ABC transporter substrate-binding protein [Nitrosospira sp. Nsp11]SHL35253.1 sulfate transport system substrate-binding protein [Nitrosospira sp. Nsp11]